MVLTALVLVLLAVALCAVGIRFAFSLLGLQALPTLEYLGVAETPAAPVSRRRR